MAERSCMPVMRWIAMRYALSPSRKSRKVGCPRQPDQWSSRAQHNWTATCGGLTATCAYELRIYGRKISLLMNVSIRACVEPSLLFSRASERPIAIACLRLVTFLPLLLFSVPFFLRRASRT